ncbi:MAG: ExbD/TolR family protein [Myxococcota bacterium]
MPKLSPQQRLYIRKRTKFEEPDPSEMQGELNIVPFLDITVNLIMFLLMLVAAIAFFAQLEARLPEYGGGGVGKRASDEPKLNLSLTVVESGVVVTGSGGKLSPGCQNTATGRVITVPKKGGEYDWAGLTECVSRVKQEFPDETQVTVNADPIVHYEHVVHAMDAVRDSGEEELFPDVLLSAGVR